MKHFEKDYLEVHWDENIKCVIMIWKKFAKGLDFRNGLDTGLNLIIEKNASKWLADLRSMQVIAVEDQNWSNEDWFPRAIKGGIRKMAIVQPTSALTKMGVKNIMSKVGDAEIETSYFDDMDEAKSWLRSF